MAGNVNYQNVGNLLPKNDFVAQGPLAGGLAGLQAIYGFNDLNNSAAASKISNEEAALKLSELQKAVPVNDAERALKLDDINTLMGMHDQRASNAEARLATPGITNRETTAKAQEKEVQTRAYVVTETLNDYFNNADGTPKKTPGLINASMYPEIKQRLESVGVKGLPATWAPEVQALLQAHFSAAYNSSQRNATMQETKYKEMQANSRATEQRLSQEKIQARHDAAQMYSAEVQAAATGERGTPLARTQLEIEKGLKAGARLDEETINTQKAVIEATATTSATGNQMRTRAEKEADGVNFFSSPETRKAWLASNGLNSNLDEAAAKVAYANKAYNEALDKMAFGRLLKATKNITPEMAKKAGELKFPLTGKTILTDDGTEITLDQAKKWGNVKANTSAVNDKENTSPATASSTPNTPPQNNYVNPELQARIEAARKFRESQPKSIPESPEELDPYSKAIQGANPVRTIVGGVREAAQSVSPPAKPSGIPDGYVMNGHRWVGGPYGDKNDQNNWVKVKQ